MAAILALLPSIISMIPTVTTGVENLIAFIGSIRTAAQQTGEWTPALELAFTEALIAKGSSKAWTPDAALPKGV